MEIHPPIVRRPTGRPKKRRIRRKEEKNPYKLTRAGSYIKCSKCRQIGHNSRGFKTGITGETTWRRRLRKKKSNFCWQQ